MDEEELEAQRLLFMQEYPRAVWYAGWSSWDGPMYTYMWQGWLAALRRNPVTTAKLYAAASRGL